MNVDFATLVAYNADLLDRHVWCTSCGRSQSVANGLRDGWPKCCGYTMTIDSPQDYPERHRWLPTPA